MDHRLRIGYVSRNGGENRGGRESGDPIWAIGSYDLPGVDAGVVFDHAQIAAAETAIRKNCRISEEICDTAIFNFIWK